MSRRTRSAMTPPLNNYNFLRGISERPELTERFLRDHVLSVDILRSDLRRQEPLLRRFRLKLDHAGPWGEGTAEVGFLTAKRRTHLIPLSRAD
jgi:hypothetical protein